MSVLGLYLPCCVMKRSSSSPPELAVQNYCVTCKLTNIWISGGGGGGACSDWAGEIVFFFSKIRTQFRSIIECVITLQPRMWDSLEILRLTEVKKGKVQLNFRFSIKRTKSTGISCDICERFHMRTPWKAIAFQNIWPPCLAFVLKCAALAAVITRYAFALKSNTNGE